MRSVLGYSSSGGKVKQSYVASTLWSLPRSSTRLMLIHLRMFPTPVLVMSVDQSSTRLPHIHLRMFSAPVLVMSVDPALAPVLPCVRGPRVHFGLNPSRRPSPLEHRFERRLMALEDSITSMRLEMTAGFIETKACIRNINLAFDDLKSSLNLGFDELRSSVTEQIRAGFAEMRFHMPGVAEIRSPMPVHQERDYSIAYNRGRKRKSSETDFGVDDNLAREICSSSQTQRIFEPNLPFITKESSEDIQVTPDVGMSGGEATTSRDDGVRPLAETVTLKVNNSLARVRASMLYRSPSRIPGFYAEYEKLFYGPMAIANSHVTISVSIYKSCIFVEHLFLNFENLFFCRIQRRRSPWIA
ncbi:uncharacterized protein [Primulina huaijiensis]|uniref:uncharacterized protein isoform X2 n=1 Tax=Primulina huaijiensis TaxID=1492673 RepID=UPI003CC6F294